jgi:ATP-binding cassette subfamily B multidrug efflux pump
MNLPGVFRSARPYLWRYRRGLFLGTGALVIKDILGAMVPLIIKYGVDSLKSGFRLTVVFEFAGALVVLSLFKGIFQYWMRVILIGMSRDIEFDLRNDLFSHLVQLSSGFYARYRTGDIMARATNDLNAVRMMLGPGIMYWAETMLTAVLAIAVMLVVDWRLTLIALIPAPLVSGVMIFFGRRIHDRFEAIQKMFSDISSRVQENLSGMRVVRAYVQEAAELRTFEILNEEYIEQNLRLARLSSVFMPLVQGLIGCTFLLVLAAGGYQLLQGRISLGSFVMFNTYMGLLVWPMIALGWVVNLMQRGAASWTRIMELMEEKAEISVAGGGRKQEFRGEIEFRGVEVVYDARAALQGVNLRIAAGTTIAIVGHTGSGKSTLASLIPRLLDPTRGTVLLDGTDLRELDPQWVRRHVGFVPQETFLFSATLGENIAWGREDATEEQIHWAAGVAGLAPDIANFPAGYKTMIGERGLTLSGGQKQRVAIARSIVRDPGVLILDDALSSVDTITEERILSGLTAVMRGRTTILISHRVSTVRDADRIFVLEHGQIVEEGSHEELVAAGGYYADLYQKQLLEEELEAI